MTQRIKATTAAPKTREEMEVLVGRIAELKIKERALKAEMDAKLKKLKDDYQGDLNDIIEYLAALLPRAMLWAEANPEDFGKSKSLELLHGVVGWRTNTPSLRTRTGWTWDRVLERLKLRRPGYVRTKQEVDKQGLLADRETLGEDELRDLGVRVVQEDEFFVEPKLTETENREVAP